VAIDWDQFQNDLDDAIGRAGQRTDARVAAKASSITRLTEAEVQELFSDPADVKKLAELMEIVKRSGRRNEKINKIVANIEQFGGIVLTLLGKLA
jgi:hypothetical protein